MDVIINKGGTTCSPKDPQITDAAGNIAIFDIDFTDTRDPEDYGGGCSCHINPPCGWCVGAPPQDFPEGEIYEAELLENGKVQIFYE